MERIAPGDSLHDRALAHFKDIFKLAQEQKADLEPVLLQLEDSLVAYERAARLDTQEPREDVIYMVYHFCETIAAFIVDNMLPEEDFGSMAGRGPEDKENEGPINLLLGWRLDKARVRPKLIRLIMRSLVLGVAWAKVPWSQQFRTINMPSQRLDPDTGEEITEMKIQSILAYSGPDLVLKGIWDVWWDRYMEEIEDGWIIDRTRMTVGEIESAAENAGWKNVPKFMKKVRGLVDETDVEEASDDNDRLRYDMAAKIPGSTGATPDYRRITGKGRYDVFEYWGPFDYEGNGNYIPCVINVAPDEEIVFRVEPMPFIHGQFPWIAARPMPWLEEFMGMSVAGINVGKQNYINDIYKLIMQHWERSINPIILRDHRAQINSREMRFKAFRTFDVKSFSGLPMSQMFHFFTPPDIKSSSLAILNQTMDMAKVESSVEDFFSSGQAKGVTKTASGISQITERAGSRHKFKLSIVEDQTIKRLGYQFFALDQQFAQDEDVQPVINAPLPRLPPESVIRWWDFTPVGSATLLNKQADRENTTFFLQTLFQGYTALRQEGFLVNFKAIFDGVAKKIDLPELAEAIQLAPAPAPEQILDEESGIPGEGGGNGSLPGGLG